MRMALPLPPGIPKHPGRLLPPPLPLCSKHPSVHLWKLTSVGLLFYTSSEPPPSFQRFPPPCFWAAQGSIPLITIPVLLFIHCSHHRDGNSISPFSLGLGQKGKSQRDCPPPHLHHPPLHLLQYSGCTPLLQALQTTGSVSPGLCTSCSFCQEHTSLGFTA